MTVLPANLESTLASALAAESHVDRLSEREARIALPVYFPDGDAFVVYVRDAGANGVEVTDKGNTLQNLSYHLDVDRLRDGTRGTVFERIRTRFGVEDRDGELVHLVPPGRELGTAVFGYVQAMHEVSDLRMLEREIVRSTFKDDLDQLLRAHFRLAVKNYTDPTLDPDEKYPIDWYINGVQRPLAVFGVATNEAALRAVVTAQRFHEWQRPMRFIAIAENQEDLSRRNVAWLSDHFDKQFSSLHNNETAITEYLEEEWQVAVELQQLRSA